MSRTFAAAALGLPVLRSIALPELEGSALRLHVSPVVTARWPSGDRGYVLLSLCPGDDPDEPAALVRLPLAQAEALVAACAAFNVILDAAERAEGLGPSPVMTGDFPPPEITTDSRAIAQSEQALEVRDRPISSKRITTPTAPCAQALITAATQVAILAGLLPAVAARCLGLL